MNESFVCSDDDLVDGLIPCYLEQVAEFYGRNQPSIEAYVLPRGQHFRPGRQVDRLGTPKMCFHNSQRIALTRAMEPIGGLTYVEGFAVTPYMPWPLHHGWVVDDEDLVLETTWKEMGTAYFGVKVLDLGDRIRARSAWGCVLPDLAAEQLKQQEGTKNGA